MCAAQGGSARPGAEAADLGRDGREVRAAQPGPAAGHRESQERHAEHLQQVRLRERRRHGQSVTQTDRHTVLLYVCMCV